MKSKVFLKLMVASLALVSAVACGKKGSGAATAKPRERATVSTNVPMGVGNNGQISVLQFQGTSAQTEQVVRAFLSPNLNPEAVGTIEKIEVSGKVTVQANGQVSSNSAIQLVVYDSLVGKLDSETNTHFGPITVALTNATGTAFNGNVNITFSDSLGTITVTGSWVNSGNFSGTVSFKNNNANYNGMSSGTLGTVSLPTCGFFVCSQ